MVLRLQKSAPNSCGLLSGFHSVSLCLLLQVSIVVSSVSCYRCKNRLRATSQLLPPRTRVARTLQQKTSFLLPGPRPIGRGRYAERRYLSCVRSFHFPPLPRPTCFFGFRAAQRLLTSLNGAASTCHLPSPNGNPRQLSNSCCFGKTQ